MFGLDWVWFGLVGYGIGYITSDIFVPLTVGRGLAKELKAEDKLKKITGDKINFIEKARNKLELSSAKLSSLSLS